MAGEPVLAPNGDPRPLGTAEVPWGTLTTSGGIADPAGNVATPAQIVDAFSDIDAVEASVTQMSADLAALQEALPRHADATNNPHGTTAAQSGAIPETARGAANGVATLDADGRLPMSQVPAALLYDCGYHVSLSALQTAYPSPALGSYARVAVSGSADKLYLYDADSGWTETGGAGSVTSVNGKTGTVALNAADVGAAASNHGHADATTTTAGFMTSAMVNKLNGVAAGAAALGSATPQPLGQAAAGSATTAAKSDHVHANYSPWAALSGVTRISANQFSGGSIPSGAHLRYAAAASRPTTVTAWKHGLTVDAAGTVCGESIPTPGGGETLFVERSAMIGATLRVEKLMVPGYWAYAAGTGRLASQSFAAMPFDWPEESARLIGAIGVRSLIAEPSGTQPTMSITAGGTDLLASPMSVSTSAANTGVVASGRDVGFGDAIEIDCESTGTTAVSQDLQLWFLIARHVA